MTALSELLNEAKADRSVDDLILSAEKRLGREINPTFRSTIYRALDGSHAKRPREETLQLFADVFELDVREVRTAASRPAGELGPWVPVAEAAQLSQPVRNALDQLIKAIAEGGEVGGDADGAGGAPTTNGPDSGPDPSGINNVTELSPDRSTVREHGERKRVANRSRRPRKPDDKGDG